MISRLSTLAALLLLSGHAFAKTCDVAIESDDAMKFNLSEIVIAADCTEVSLTLTHTGTMAATVMGHNWVLTRTADYRPIGIAGGRASAEDSYVPKDDARVLAVTPVIGGGQSTTITFSTDTLVAGEDYTFFCSYPGHWPVMKGTFVFG